MSRRPARRLIEPDFWTCPHGVRVRPKKALTYGPEVAEVNAAAGFAPDPQQELGLDHIFAINPDGSPATFEFCVICARQNLKTGLLLMAAIGWLYVIDVPEIVWSAHEMSTTRDAQRDLGRIIKGAPSLRKRMLPQKNDGIYDANGEERIELAEGQTVWFKARTRDGGRGLAKPKLILDEAFALKAPMMGALIPIMLAQHHPQVLYASSPGKADSEALHEIRNRGRAGTSPRLTYLEWGGTPLPTCEDPDCLHPKSGLAYGAPCVANRIEVIESRNPTLSTGRITIQTLADIRQAITTASEWFRECMGKWEEPGEGAGPPAVDLRRWSDLGDPATPAPTKAAVVLDVEPDRSSASVGVAGNGPGGRTLLMVRVGSPASVVQTLLNLKKNIDVLEVALHPSGQAGTLTPQLIAAGIKYVELVHKDVSRGCSGFLTGVDEGRFTHLRQAELDGAVGVARTKTTPTEAMLWDRSATPGTPLSPLVSVSTAAQRWALLTAKPDTPPPPPRRVTREPATRGRDKSIAQVGF